jgi:hypothetical protein
MNKNELVDRAIEALSDEKYYTESIEKKENFYEEAKKIIAGGKKILVRHGDKQPLIKVGYCVGINGLPLSNDHSRYAEPFTKKIGDISFM